MSVFITGETELKLHTFLSSALDLVSGQINSLGARKELPVHEAK
jgi:hypothetical protein